MAALIEYQAVDSPLHGLHPLTKMVGALAILVLSILFTDYRFLGGIFMLVIALAALSRVFVTLSRMFKGLSIFALILFFIQILFYDEGRTLFHLIPLGEGYLAVTDRGVVLGLSMALRMLTIVTSFLLFLATTRTQDVMNTLVEKGVPNDIAFMILTSIRFIPTFLQELQQISDAQRSRAFVNEGWNPLKKVKAYLPIAVPLVLLSLKKAQQMVLAMETRGYGCGPRSKLRELKLRAKDICAMGLMLLVITAAMVLKMQGFGVLS